MKGTPIDQLQPNSIVLVSLPNYNFGNTRPDWDDFTKTCDVRAINFNEADLITCFSNDYGYEKWIEKAIEFYGSKGDILILISSSGKSKNMLNACKAARRKKIQKIITFTGHKKNNPLSKLGDINLWVDSNIYNHVENTHQIWLLAVCDLIKINKIK